MGDGAMPSLDEMNAWSVGTLPGLIGLEITGADQGLVEARLALRPELLAPNGYLHAATVIALADTACGYGTRTHLPPGAVSFTTIELKSNFLGTAREGAITCTATLAHSGRTTQLWDATVRDAATGKTLALFRCTQLLLYPPAQPAEQS
jgi:1,4-dihydroxy-2-naphthoyl-CoA hydrolase